MKKSPFGYLLDESKQKEQRGFSLQRLKKLILVLFVLFFILYLHYKPYQYIPHENASIIEFFFNLLYFIIFQTLGIVHEGGHGVCYILPCPKFIMILNGTLFQWGFPLGIAYYYKKQGNTMAFLAGVFILGLSMHNTAVYMSTATQGAILPADKSFLGVDALHDFYYIFNTLGVLSWTAFISGFTKFIGFVVMIGAVIGMFFEGFSQKD